MKHTLPTNPPRPSVQDVAYTHGYYRALSPTMLATALEMKGLRAPDLGKPLNYCELGMGFGVSLIANAACFPHMRFFGNDFNAAHVAYARGLARDAGLHNVELFEDCFEQMLERALPQMDFIVLHGIYSWVSPCLRKVIVDFIAARLKPGGVVYVSHNTLPGWATLMPLRELFNLHAWRTSPASMSSADRAKNAWAFVNDMGERSPAYFVANPGVAERLRMLNEADPRYMAHEYFNPDWHPLYFHQVAQEMSAAQLVHAGPAHLEDHVEAASFSAATRAHLGSIDDPILRETLCDYHLNRGFRRDLYTRGAELLSPAEREAKTLDRLWALVTARTDIDAEPPCDCEGAALIDAQSYADLLDALSEGAISARQLLERTTLAPLGSERLIQVLMLMCGAGHVQPALPQPPCTIAQDSADRFNSVSLSRSTDDGLHQLVSSLTGQATGWTRMAMLQISLHRQGVVEADAMARAMHARLVSEGRPVTIRGNTLHGEDAILAHLRDAAQVFINKEVPLLRNMGVL